MTRPILIIEDDADISESLKYNFEREGLVAVTAPTGEAGLSAALNEREPPRLIILDLMLPGMSGIELCRRLRRERRYRNARNTSYGIGVIRRFHTKAQSEDAKAQR